MSNLIKVCEDDILRGDDGFFVFWPAGATLGAFSAENLRELADELDRRNKPWEEQINEYMRNQDDQQR